MKPRISAVIPVKNESRGLDACLAGILGQTVAVEEIIVLDSGSDDGSREIAAGYPKVRVIEVRPEDFNHGQTRNLGVRQAKGDYVLLTVGDAWSVDEFWIERLMAGFVDENVAGVCGAQVVPHTEYTNPVEWFRPRSEAHMKRVQFASAQHYDAAPPEEKQRAAAWDDVTALYRTSALRQVPFRRAVYGEDALWASDTLRAGRALVYQPAARVYHFHLNSYESTLKRTIAVCCLRYRAFDSTPGKVRPWETMARRVYRLLTERGLGARERLYWLRYNLQTVRALSKGVTLFRRALARGDACVDALHEQYCDTPPVSLKQSEP